MPLLSLHTERVNHSRKELFNCQNRIELSELIHPGPYLDRGEYKCRVIYEKNIIDILYKPYKRKKIRTAKLVDSEALSYKHKFLNRDKLDELYNQRELADEILIVNNGFISDAYYYNLVFWDGAQWYTPSDNLLGGVMRTQLLRENKIKELSIRPEDLPNFQKVSFINALNELGRIEISTDSII